MTPSAEFIDIVTFDKLAATCGEYLSKGREVAVVGRLHLNEWTSREGERRSRIQVVADAVQFLGAPTKKATEPADDDGRPADRPAVGAYRSRKASSPRPRGGHPPGGRPLTPIAILSKGVVL